MRVLSALVAVCIVAVGCAGGDESAAPPAWNHDPANATLGPAGWGALAGYEECGTGTRQSPVDLAAAVDADLPTLQLDYPPTPVVVKNTGHTVEAEMPESGGPVLTIEGTQYRLLQYHFHAPSEHTLDGKSFPAEAHLVHQSEDGELAVIGVFLERPGPLGLPSLTADAIVESAPDRAGEDAAAEDVPSPLLFLGVVDAASALLDYYYVYDGSLTTPACSEEVRWIVVPEPSGISTEALDRLHDLVAGFPSYEGYENNNRPIQPLNERTIRRDSG